MSDRSSGSGSARWRQLLSECSSVTTSKDPSIYTGDGPNRGWAADVLHKARCEREAILESTSIREVRNVLRTVALIAQREPKDKDYAELRRELAYEWVILLIEPDLSSRSFFLQGHRLEDSTFYRADQNGDEPRATGVRVQPKEWVDWPEAWRRQLSFLKSPDRLTITELELALVIFKWGEGKPRFVWWLEKHPHLLWRIHAFLLKRYAFYLLRLFEQARRASNGKLNAPPYRAGEQMWFLFWSSRLMCSPRLIGLNAIGCLGLLASDTLVAFFFESPLRFVGAALAATSVFGVALYYADVFKQNRGVLAGWRHASSRVAHVYWLAALWSVPPLIGAWFVWLAVGYAQGADVVAPAVLPAFWSAAPTSWPATGSMAVRWLAFAGTAIVLGAIVQWFWQDESAIEPI